MTAAHTQNAYIYIRKKKTLLTRPFTPSIFFFLPYSVSFFCVCAIHTLLVDQRT